MAGTNGPFQISNQGAFDSWYFGRKFSPQQPDALSWTEVKSVEAFGPMVDRTQTVTGAAGISLTVAFGSPTVAASESVVGAGGLALTIAFGSPTVAASASVVGAGALTASVAFGSPTVTPGAVSVVGAGAIALTAALGTPTVTAGSSVVDAGAIALSVAFGSPTVTAGAVSVVGAGGIALSTALGSPTVTSPAYVVGAGGIALSVTFGSPVVTIATPTQYIVGAGGLSVAVAFGSPTVTHSTIIPFDSTRTAEAWSVVVRISGIGETHIAGASLDGRWSFTNANPAYADDTWKEWLSTFPALMSEEIDPTKGGIAASGSITAQLIDGSDSDGDRDAVTALLRTGAGAIARVENTVSPLDSSIRISGDAGIVAGDIVFVGPEAIKPFVVGDSGKNLNSYRAVLGTDAMAHSPGELVYAYNPSLAGRRIEVLLVPTDSLTADDEVLIGTYSLDDFKITQHGALEFSGASLLRYLSRLCASQQPNWTLHQFTNAGSLIVTHAYTDNGNLSAQNRFYSLWSDARNFIQLGDDSDSEIIRVNTSTGQSLQIDLRGTMGTTPKDHDFLSVIRPVLVADELYSSFRVSVSQSTTRASGWVVSSHWVDILLCLLTSSARTSDGFELTNLYTSFPNWSCLPPGWGVSLPAELIDFQSFLDVKARTAGWQFPSFALAQPITFAGLANQHFLEPLGAWLTFEGGKLKLVLPRVPMLEEDLTAFDDDVYLAGSPRFHLALSDAASSVTFTYKTPSGSDVTLSFKSGDFATFVNARGLYGLERDIAVDVPGVRSSDRGLVPFLRQIAQRKLFRLSKPQWEIELDTDLDQFSVGPGTFVSFTHPELIDTSLGVRGATYPAQVTTRQPSVEEKLTGFHYGLRSFGPALRVARVTPSALITASPSGSVITVAANEFTCPDGASSQPLTDASAFNVGDVVTLKNLDGSSFASSAETITAIDIYTHQITLTGDFGLSGGLGDAVDSILDYVGYDSASDDQKAAYVFGADSATMTIGGGDDPPFVYGEP